MQPFEIVPRESFNRGKWIQDKLSPITQKKQFQEFLGAAARADSTPTPEHGTWKRISAGLSLTLS